MRDDVMLAYVVEAPGGPEVLNLSVLGGGILVTYDSRFFNRFCGCWPGCGWPPASPSPLRGASFGQFWAFS